MIDVEQIAMIAHEANRAYQSAIGDLVSDSWDTLSSESKQSIIKGVRFALNTPALGPRDQHELWMRSKISEGWKYGCRKCDSDKTHPCIVPWEQLPAAQRVKDVLFRNIIATFSEVIT